MDHTQSQGDSLKKNMGSIDRAIRIVVALAAGILILTGNVTGALAIILGAVALVFVLTGAVSFCPLYAAFRISTKKSDAAK